MRVFPIFHYSVSIDTAMVLILFVHLFLRQTVSSTSGFLEFWLLKSFHPFFHNVVWPWVKELQYKCIHRRWALTMCWSLHWVKLWFNVITPICYKGKHIWWWRAATLIQQRVSRTSWISGHDSEGKLVCLLMVSRRGTGWAHLYIDTLPWFIIPCSWVAAWVAYPTWSISCFVFQISCSSTWSFSRCFSFLLIKL